MVEEEVVEIHIMAVAVAVDMEVMAVQVLEEVEVMVMEQMEDMMVEVEVDIFQKEVVTGVAEEDMEMVAMNIILVNLVEAEEQVMLLLEILFMVEMAEMEFALYNIISNGV